MWQMVNVTNGHWSTVIENYGAALQKVEKDFKILKQKWVKKTLKEINEDKDLKKEDLDGFNNRCEECKKEDDSVSQNLILTGFKICKSCRTSKTVFPI